MIPRMIIYFLVWTAALYCGIWWYTGVPELMKWPEQLRTYALIALLFGYVVLTVLAAFMDAADEQRRNEPFDPWP